MKSYLPWNLVIHTMVLCFMISSCAPSQQFIDFTPKSKSDGTPIFDSTIEPTIQPAIIPTTTPTKTPTQSPSLTPTTIPTLPPGIENKIKIEFNNTISYTVNGVSFSNHDVDGFSHWATHLQNIPDASLAPVYGLGLEYQAQNENVGKNYMHENLVSSKHPVYQWFFGDVFEEPINEVYMAEAYIESAQPIPFTPGFDASISTNISGFSETGIQTITIMIIPKQKMTFPGITVHTQGGPNGNLVNAEIVDPPPGEKNGPNNEIISVSPDKKNLFVNNFPLEENRPYSFVFSVKVDPHGQKTNYLPWVSISWCPQLKSTGKDMSFGQKLGNELKWEIENTGTWFWTANGEYSLEWHGGNVYMVNFSNQR